MHTSILYYQSVTVQNQFVLNLLAAKTTLTHLSKTAAQWHYRKTIGLNQSAGAIVIR